MTTDTRATTPSLRVVQDLSVVTDSPVHEVEVSDEGSFTVARCGCGWRSYARRSRSLARSEGQDHLRLYAPPTG